jgi:nitrogen fixation NifU-like protein
MSELSELYQQVILDHNKKPRNFRKLETANHSAEGFNPLCGDQLKLDEDATANGLGNLKIFSGVREFPVRVKCASLPWHTMHAALNNQGITSTE